MTIVLADRVLETSTTTGTGTLDLDGAATGFQGFVAGAGGGSEVYYSIVGRDGGDAEGEWEVGIGTVTDASPDTLSRDTVLSSSDSGSKVTFSAGTKDVFLTVPASKSGFSGALVYLASDQSIPNNTLTDVEWDQEQYDEGGWHDNSTNPERLTVPAGVDWVKVKTHVCFASDADGQRSISFRKNGASIHDAGGFVVNVETPNATGIQAIQGFTAVMPVVAGDYFTVKAYHNEGAALNVEEEYSWFSIEAV